jgi:serine/threonine-protein kinase
VQKNGRNSTGSDSTASTSTLDIITPKPHWIEASTASVLEAGSTEASSSPPAAQAPAVGSVLQARRAYRLIRVLGSGAFGSVFLADTLSAPADSEDDTLGPVAVKVLGATSDPRVKASLKRELMALRGIKHRCIPKLHDWSTEGDLAFVVMDYFQGGSLADTRAFLGRLDEGQTWRLLSDLLSALAAAHRASVLHLDVKPSNVLLDGNRGYVLTDFGVSHASRMSQGLLQQGHFPIGLGTHGYRAPEQITAQVQSFDLRTDLWGVGATAWAMVTGIDLKQNKGHWIHERSDSVFGLPRISEIVSDVSPPLEEVIMGLLYTDPSRRPGGAAEVLAQIVANVHHGGLDSTTIASARRDALPMQDLDAVIESLMDPLWSSICRAPGFERYFVRFEDGEVLSSRGSQALHTILLLKGAVQVEADGVVADIEDQEGTLLGAISTLTGAPRDVTLRARGTVWTCLFNEAEFEQLVTCNPAVAVRMLRSLAKRLVDGPDRHRILPE